MGFFNRRRSFDRNQAGVQPDSTGYQEKTVYSADVSGQYSDNGFASQAQQSGAYSVGAQGYGAPNSDAQGYGAQSYGMPSGQTVTDVDYPPVEKQTELPKVYASREHPDIYIYEFSDRLEYYFRTANSMCKLKTVKR